MFQTNFQWYSLFLCNDFNKILHFGDHWCANLTLKIQKQFQQNELDNWVAMIRNCPIEGKNDIIMHTNFSYDCHIFDSQTFFLDLAVKRDINPQL